MKKENKIEIIEYQLQSKFKIGDKVRVRVNDTLYLYINEKVGVIVEFNSPSPNPYVVKFDDNVWLWFLSENDLEKVEEPTYKEETINNIIQEIKEYQERITVLLNRLEQEVKSK